MILLHANKKDMDQHAHSVILYSWKYDKYTCYIQKINIVAVSVAEQVGLRVTRLQTSKIGFLISKPIFLPALL